MSKYEKDEIASIMIYADEISLYTNNMNGTMTYGADRQAEKKQLPIKVRLVKTEGRPQQFTFELCGPYHIEQRRIKDNWFSYGKFWLSIEESEKLANFISSHTPKQMTF